MTYELGIQRDRQPAKQTDTNRHTRTYTHRRMQTHTQIGVKIERQRDAEKSTYITHPQTSKQTHTHTHTHTHTGWPSQMCKRETKRIMVAAFCVGRCRVFGVGADDEWGEDNDDSDKNGDKGKRIKEEGKEAEKEEREGGK